MVCDEGLTPLKTREKKGELDRDLRLQVNSKDVLVRSRTTCRNESALVFPQLSDTERRP